MPTLGLDQGATRAQAMKNLFYVPRYRGHTIIHPVTAKYGRVKVNAWPLASGTGGVRAGRLMESICRLAGLENIGVKARLPLFLHAARVLTASLPILMLLG